MKNKTLYTIYGEKLDSNNVLQEYPRPQLKRNNYTKFNGIWEYCINTKKEWNEKTQGTILVPFPIESELSGIKKDLKSNEYLLYRKYFTIDNLNQNNNTLLHFDGVDCICDVFINQICIGSHVGGYLPFQFDITSALKQDENEILVIVKDETSTLYPIGKQSLNRGGIWYTPCSGIWKSVWLETVPPNYVKNLKITPNYDESCITFLIESNASSFEIEILYHNELLYHEIVHTNEIAIPIPKLYPWSPEEPNLYDVKIKTNDDEIYSYFAMRKFEAKNGKFYLNNQPYFINGVLDQGYYSDGIYTPASYEAYKDDILYIKKLGFNALRKHIKIEPMMFYYYCDTIGMLVLQDMVNLGNYNIVKDTVLPLFLQQKTHLPFDVTNAQQKDMFIEHCIATVQALYNVPSIVYYTIFNEGWGQFKHSNLYSILKEIDSSRVYDTTSGWFHCEESDVYSEHIYFKKIHIKSQTKPVILSEFGGYVYKVDDHIFNEKKEFGYKKIKTIIQYENDLIQLYETQILPEIKNGLAGAIYTQLSDVEDEINGFITYDRKVKKINDNRIKDVFQKIENLIKEMN